jgi:hypothetical protein
LVKQLRPTTATTGEVYGRQGSIVEPHGDSWRCTAKPFAEIAPRRSPVRARLAPLSLGRRRQRCPGRRWKRPGRWHRRVSSLQGQRISAAASPTARRCPASGSAMSGGSSCPPSRGRGCSTSSTRCADRSRRSRIAATRTRRRGREGLAAVQVRRSVRTRRASRTPTVAQAPDLTRTSCQLARHPAAAPERLHCCCRVRSSRYLLDPASRRCASAA